MKRRPEKNKSNYNFIQVIENSVSLNYYIKLFYMFFLKKCDIYKKHLGLRIYKRSSEVVGMLCNMSKNNKKNNKIKNQAKTKQNKKQKKTCNNLQISWRHILKYIKCWKWKSVPF